MIVCVMILRVVFRTCALLLLLAAQTTSQADRRYFAYERALNVAANSGQTCAVLDPAVFAHSAPGTPDLRLYSGEVQVPFVLRQGPTLLPRQELPAVLNLGVREGAAAFDAEMPGSKYSTVVMDIAARNFVTTVDVTGSPSPSGTPATKLGTYTIFDLTGEKLDRSMVLHLPESNFRFLHFVVHRPINPQDIGGITVTNVPMELAVYTTISATDVVKQVGSSTVIHFDIPANLPVDRIQFVPGDRPLNFSRGVAVRWRSQSSTLKAASNNPGSGDLPVLEKGVVRRIHTVREGHRIDDEQFSLDPGYAADALPTRMTIAILNGDDAPLSINAVRLQMRERKLCFDAGPSSQYTLYYGDSQLTAPQYDYASLFQPEEHSALASLGPEQANALFERRPDRRPLTERYPAMLWIALVAVIAVLGYVALRTARRMSS